MEIKNKSLLQNSGFIRSLTGLLNCKDLDLKTSYSISKIQKKLGEASKDLNGLIDKFRQKHIEMEGENPKTNDKGETVYKTSKNEAEKEWDEIMEITNDIPVHKIPVSRLSRAKLSASDINSLESILEIDIEKEDKKNVVAMPKQK